MMISLRIEKFPRPWPLGKAREAREHPLASGSRTSPRDFRRPAGLTERHRLAVAFAAIEPRNVTGVDPVDKDPGEYVSQAEAGVAEPGGSAADGDGDGSLGIGGLHRA